MEALLNHFSSQFYTDLIVFILAIIALSISIINRDKHYLLRLFPYYFIAYIILILILFIHTIFFLDSPLSQKMMQNIDGCSDYIFTLIEFVIFMHFLYNIISSTKRKKIMIFLIILFLVLYVFYFAKDLLIYRIIRPDTVTIVYTLESTILLIPSLFYYFQLFTKPPTINLIKESSFWVVTGIFFSMICSLPYCIIENYMRKNNFEVATQLFSIFYVLYSLLFLMIIKAYSCENNAVKYELNAKLK